MNDVAVKSTKLTPHERTADRVNWFEAHARRDRWCEEVEILEAELTRCHRFFDFYAGAWKSLAQGDAHSGRKAYCLKISFIFSKLRDGVSLPITQRCASN